MDTNLEKHKILIPLILALAPVGCSIGLYSIWPWISSEHERLEPWKIPLSWTSEGIALVWFAIFAVNWFTSKLLSVDPTDWNRKANRLRPFVLTFAFGLVIDIAFTALAARDEYIGYASARHTNGKATVVKTIDDHRLYVLRCMFRDSLGAQHTTTHRVSRDQFDHEKAGKLRLEFDRGKQPVDVVVAYDPRWPRRCWIEPISPGHGNRLYAMSAVVLMFSVIFTGTVIELRKKHPNRSWIPERTCPFLALSAVMSFWAVLNSVRGPMF